MPNDINSVSPSIRDFLLNRNLILSDTVTDNGLSGAGIGLGTQGAVETLPNAVQASEDIEDGSVEYRDSQILKNPYSSTEDSEFAQIESGNMGTGNLAPGTPSVEYGSYVGSRTEDSSFSTSSKDTRNIQTLKNQYISNDDMVSATIVNNSFAYEQKDGGYLDKHGQLNVGGPSTGALDAIGGILTQKGFGLGGGGLSSQFDIRSSLAGRVLSATGVINDTQLGIIGGQQLLLALGQKAIFNTQKEILGKINLNPFSHLKSGGASFINPDYTITVRTTTGGKILGKILDIAGFQSPNSVINPDASIFQDSQIPFYNFTHLIDSGSIEKNKTLIDNTGKGQQVALFDSLNRNTYKPDYGKEDAKSKYGIKEPLLYHTTDLDTSEENDTIETLNSDGTTFIWGEPRDFKSNTLLAKTKEFFFKNSRERWVNFTNNVNFRTHGQLSTPVNHKGSPMLSKGSGVLGQQALYGSDNVFGENENTDEIKTDKVFYRTWTSTDRYDNVSSLQKHTGLIDFPDKIRTNVDDSVLGKNGFVKVSPYKAVGFTGPEKGDVKKYMFSIENLAWDDNKTNLPEIEKGPGDLTTGTSGRIMWFPPYGMKFTDVSTPSWDTIKFIGRGEPMYTYNSTERSGTLNFQIIIDYPDYMNNYKIGKDEVYASIAAGATDYNKIFTVPEQEAIENDRISSVNKTKKAMASDAKNIPDLFIYFDHNLDEVDSNYENSIEDGIEYGLNIPWTKPGNVTTLKNDLNSDSSSYDIYITGYASLAGTTAYNLDLSTRRANNVKTWVLAQLGPTANDVEFAKRVKKPKYQGEEDSKSTGTENSPEIKGERKVRIEFKRNLGKDKQILNATEAKIETQKDTKEFVNKITKKFHDEGKYFKELASSDEQSDKIIYSEIKDKIKYFQPAFHSITPEGFNSRLNFLHQCTRQGPTNQDAGSQNLAFGKPPVCILRIGDFYNTKIIIENMSLDYEPLVWDLNPEGVGVQPMIANVVLTFKFIGGSSLKGPINKLQNAVSFNYFANTQIYDPRADSIRAKNKDENAADKKLNAEHKKKNGKDSKDLTFATHTIQDGVDYIPRPRVPHVNVEVRKASLIPVEVDQTLATEVQLSKPVVDTGSDSSVDKSEMENLALSSISYADGTDTIELTFKYNQKGYSTFNLSKSYTGKVYLNRYDELAYSQYLGYVTATPDGVGSFKIEDSKGSSTATFSDGSLTGAVDLFSMTEASVDALTLIRTNGDKGLININWANGLTTKKKFQ